MTFSLFSALKFYPYRAFSKACFNASSNCPLAVRLGTANSIAILRPISSRVSINSAIDLAVKKL
ncbi:hypothetical protein DERP_000022 [Dermatophagoides pteronyssinus]|uniref:Uncharacterized protein n=1 Tax=Dermatophagoides pteronyssinus TaxID=6956 RepID=A0ABQ8IYZ0_DERPT|nr:hypothetical protein DERP_000022 [Dermatophagoides pteronyssinus]